MPAPSAPDAVFCSTGPVFRPRRATLCFSGHRNYAPSPSDEIRLSEALQAAYADGYRTFISGMATGFDLAAARAVILFRDSIRAQNPSQALSARPSCPDVRLICAVPFTRQAAKYSPADKLLYDTVFAAADEVCTLSGHYFYGCYFRRDEWMVERSSRIICWYDGSKKSTNSGATTASISGASSGTRYTVKKALSAGLEIVNLYREIATLF